MERKISSRLEDLNLSRDEVERLGNAFKQEEFRKLLLDYAQEISDPVNRKEYEDGITQLEKQRGVDVKFVHPEPQYVLKTCYNPGGEKVFVNICSNSLVGKPDSTPCLNSEGAPGSNWRLPLIQAPPREDLDKSGALCTVYDVLFHPETHALSAKDRRFRNFVEETALNAVEETYSVKLDRNSIKRPRLKFKGVPRPTVIRTRRSESSNDNQDIDDDILINQFPYPYDMPPEKLKPVRQLKPMNMEYKPESNLKESSITPKYSLKESSDVDMSNYEQNLLSHHGITVPERLVLVVDLPYIKSSSELDLDLEAQKILLCSNGKRRYKLELKLPYPVEESKGTAKFDKDAGKLLVTMIVDRQKAVMKKPNAQEGDSGIESDLGGGRTSSGEEEETRVSECHPAADSDKVTGGGEKIIRADGLSQLHNCSSAVAENIHRRMSADKVMEETLEGELEVKKLGYEPGNEENYSCVPEEKTCERRKPTEATECELVSSKEAVEGGLNAASKDVIRPDIPHLMPAFSCSCTREQENLFVTFILNVKNVDPCSVKKSVTCIKHKEGGVEKPNLLGCVNGSSLPSENGSIRNEYRTVGVESWPAAIPSVDSGDVVSDLYSKSEESNRPNEICKESVNLGDVVSADGIKPSDCGPNFKSSYSSRMPQNNKPENDVSRGANSPLVDGECLSDYLQKSLMINDAKTELNPHVEGENAADGKEMICFLVAFSSVGAGYFPQNYSFCVSFPSSQWPNVVPEWSDSYPSLEVWDNNVEVQWRKPLSESDEREKFDCFLGQDLVHLQAYKLPPFEVKDVEPECFSEPEPLKASGVKEAHGDHSDSSQTSGTKSENEKNIEPTLTAEERRKMFKGRTLSESSVESNPAKQAMKGILKRKGRAGLGRSLSESSGGEEYGWMAPLLSQSSSVGSSPSLSDINRLTLGESLKEEEEEYDEEEEDDEEDGEKVKKIVRFSDVISQKTYRSNSSILGQRKKNQRKLRNKKRAAERRASESENSVDEGDTGTDKSDCNSDSSPPDKAEITVQQEQSSAKGKSKASAKKKGNGNKGKGKRVDPKVSNPGEATVSQHLEMKSDLIFQLEL